MKITTDGPRERILLMGAAGSGKSQAVLSIARNTDAKVHVLDTELDVYERLAHGAEGLEGIVPTGVMPDDWRAMLAWAEETSTKVSRDDWVVVDSITPAWSAAQVWFSEEIIGEHLADMMVKARKQITEDDKNVNPFEGWTDWSVINAQYAKFMNRLLRANAKGAHLLFTAEIDVLQKDNETKETRALFGKLGVKPRGNKRLPHVPHDIIMMRQMRTGWEMETAKVQGERAEVNGAVSDFAKQYLLGVGGWKVAS